MSKINQATINGTTYDIEAKYVSQNNLKLPTVTVPSISNESVISFQGYNYSTQTLSLNLSVPQQQTYVIEGGQVIENSSQTIWETITGIYNLRATPLDNLFPEMSKPKYVGAMMAWNQLAQDSSFGSGYPTGAVVTYDSGADKTSYSATIGGSAYGYASKSNFAIKIDHIYLLSFYLSGTNISSVWGKADNAGATPASISYSAGRFSFIQKSTRTISTGNSLLVGVSAPNGTAVTADISKVLVVDLTIAFGSTIADYVYTLESGTPGAGIAWLTKYFPNITSRHHAYDAGSLQSVETDTAVNVGFNQWDEEWEVGDLSSTTGQPISATDRIRCKNYIPVSPSTNYYISCPNNARILEYDANQVMLKYWPSGVKESVFQTLSNTAYIKFYMWPAYGTTYNHDICINLSDPAKNGTYEPYRKSEYALGHSTLRGLWKLDGNNKPYAVGDVKVSGSVTRKYGIVDLGTLNYTRRVVDENAFYANVPLMKAFGDTSLLTNIVCGKYATISFDSYDTHTVTGICAYLSGTSSQIGIHDPLYNDADTFKTAMDGVYLVFELKTYTIETADTYTTPQITYNGGTEALTDYAYENSERDIQLPIGTITEYPTLES